MEVNNSRVIEYINELKKERKVPPAIPPRKKPRVVQDEAFKVPSVEWKQFLKGHLAVAKK